MPGGDGTGPMGMGRMTGRGLGYCGGFSAPGWVYPMRGMGWGRGGFGRGRGWRHTFYATGLTGWQRTAMTGAPLGPTGLGAPPEVVPVGPGVTTQQRLDALKAQAAHFEDALQNIRQQITGLEAQVANKTDQ